MMKAKQTAVALALYLFHYSHIYTIAIIIRFLPTLLYEHVTIIITVLQYTL